MVACLNVEFEISYCVNVALFSEMSAVNKLGIHLIVFT